MVVFVILIDILLSYANRWNGV